MRSLPRIRDDGCAFGTCACRFTTAPSRWRAYSTETSITRRAYTDSFGYRIVHGRRPTRPLQRLSLTVVLSGGGPPPALARGSRLFARDRASRVSVASDPGAAGAVQGHVSRGRMAALPRDVRRRRHRIHAVATPDDAQLEHARAGGGQVCGAAGGRAVRARASAALRGVLHEKPEHRRPARCRRHRRRRRRRYGALHRRSRGRRGPRDRREGLRGGGGRRRAGDPGGHPAPDRALTRGSRRRRDGPRPRRGSRRLSVSTPLLFGADPTPGVVAATLAEDGRTVRLWLREAAATRVEHVAFTPFLLSADEALFSGAAGLVATTRLPGGGGLCWL